MSFILDALKKLEQKRQQSSVPDLLTVHEPTPQEPKSRSMWPYLLMVALLLNAGILLLWLHPWQSEKPDVAIETTTEIKATEKVPKPKLDSTLTAPVKTGVNEAPRHQPAKDKANLQRKVSIEPAPIIETMDSPEIPARVLNLDELPLTVRQDLPDLTISGHIYSNEPTSRLVNINGQIIREGQAVRDSLKLMEITPSGAIFSYKGYRFRIRGL